MNDPRDNAPTRPPVELLDGLSAYLDGETTGGQHKSVEHALDSSAELRAEAREYRLLDEMLRLYAQEDGYTPAGTGTEDRAPLQRVRWAAWKRQGRVRWAAAGASALAVCVAMWVTAGPGAIPEVDDVALLSEVGGFVTEAPDAGSPMNAMKAMVVEDGLGELRVYETPALGSGRTDFTCQQRDEQTICTWQEHGTRYFAVAAAADVPLALRLDGLRNRGL